MSSVEEEIRVEELVAPFRGDECVKRFRFLGAGFITDSQAHGYGRCAFSTPWR